MTAEHSPQEAPHPGYLGPVAPSQALELYDPATVARVKKTKLGSQALRHYFHELASLGSLPKSPAGGDIIDGGPEGVIVKDSTGEIRQAQVVKQGLVVEDEPGSRKGPTIPIERSQTRLHRGAGRAIIYSNENPVASALKTVEDRYMGNVVDITMKRREETGIREDGGRMSFYGATRTDTKEPEVPEDATDEPDTTGGGQEATIIAPPWLNDLERPGERSREDRSFFGSPSTILRSLRLGVARLRYNWSKKTADNLERDRETIQAITQEVVDGSDPAFETRPRNRRQRQAAERASRRKRKAHREYYDARSIAQTYGAEPTVRGPLLPADEVVEDRREYHKPERITDIGTPEHRERLRTGGYLRSERRSERRSTLSWRWKRNRHASQLRRNQGQIEGRDPSIRGRVLNRRLERAKRQADKHRKTIQKLERH